MLKVATLAAVLALAVCCFAGPAEHYVKNLPGLPAVNFEQYAGLVDVSSTKKMFYWFVQSQSDPANDPVVLWLNGGPGGSSLMGLWVEHGPFRLLNDSKTIVLNQYAWNRVANIIYLESPVGVGFSHSSEKLYTFGDKITSEENYAFLTKWFGLFPEFKKNPFFITGESYAGHYVPQLATEIMDNDVDHQINMKGFMLGNPGQHYDWVTGVSPYSDAWSPLQFLYSRGMIPQKTFARAEKACGWEDYLSECSDKWHNPSAECLEATAIAYAEMPSDIDAYSLNAPICLDPQLDYVKSWNPVGKILAEKRMKENLQFDACDQNYVPDYMNTADVQEALHISPKRSWDFVSYVVNMAWNITDKHSDMTLLYPRLLTNENWRILIFSGDADLMVPFTNTQKWTSCLGLSVKKGFRQWHVRGQVAGSVVAYDGLEFATVKGAGHMVPWYTPEQGYELFARYLSGKAL